MSRSQPPNLSRNKSLATKAVASGPAVEETTNDVIDKRTAAMSTGSGDPDPHPRRSGAGEAHVAAVRKNLGPAWSGPSKPKAMRGGFVVYFVAFSVVFLGGGGGAGSFISFEEHEKKVIENIDGTVFRHLLAPPPPI